MAKSKPKSTKKSLLTVTLNPQLYPQFLHLLSPKSNPNSSHTLLFIFTFFLASILCFVSIESLHSRPSLSAITHVPTYSPLVLASLSSVFQDPGVENDDTVSLDTTSMVPLPPRTVVGTEFWKQPDGEGYRPCLHFSLKYRKRSVKIANEEKRFLVVVVSGGLVELRNQIVDAVVIARILEAALVLPILQGDESEFSEIFDVEHFRKTLKADIRVVSSLPSTHVVSWQSLKNHIPHNVPPFWIRARFFKKLNEKGSLVLTGLDSKLTKNLPPDLQKLRCKVAFHALKFARPVTELGNRIARRMWIEGPYIALHLSLEKDLWIKTGCSTGLGPDYDILISKERESHPEFLTTSSNISCPLHVLQAARLLKESGAPANARVYITGGDPFGGDRAILLFKSEFVNVVTKEMLARDAELNPYRNRSIILTAIDYIVSLSSDVFLPSYDGHMVQALQGHRAYVGHRKLVTMSTNYNGQPQPRGKRRDRDVTAFPLPECMCKH
uniref:O-fucosyltransferase 37 n=1 Tax=Erigeron canadensis TaxID=72917 RepID=UPI001CB8A642|nr:O-fucosyltransferase 37 [Erigeron canadensis]